VLKNPVEEILTQCAAGVTACWFLRKGKELQLASDAVASYIPTLRAIIQETNSTRIRKATADLLVQSFLLKSALARHTEGATAALGYAQQAAKYSTHAENTIMQVLSWRTVAANQFYMERWEQALQSAQQATFQMEQTKEPLPRIIQSYVYAGLATYQAHQQQRDALNSLQKAYTAFSAQPLDEIPLWVDHDQGNLLLNDGLVNFHLEKTKDAINAYEQVLTISTRNETIVPEVLLNAVLTEVQRDDRSRDIEWCIENWIAGIEGAKTLKSEQRFLEARGVYIALRAAWPAEQRIKDLRMYISHW
jgi:tetratricopeptide (TPR) repeat protein